MRGDAHHQADLLGFFRSEGPPKAWLDGPVTLPPTSSSPAGAFPEPWRTAVVRGLPDDLPAHTTSLLGPGDLPAGQRLLTWLDTNWDGDPERALELAAIGPELRDRAIDRARAAGEAEPERFHAHRRYLPEATEREAGALIDSVLALAVVFDLHWPVDGSVRISSPFGDRVHPVLRTRKFHNGVDLPVPVGTPIHAAQEGVIVAATEDRTSGMYVIVEHAGGIRTAYCHLSRLPTKGFGERVERGGMDRATPGTPGEARVRTCTSSCASTAPRSTPRPTGGSPGPERPPQAGPWHGASASARQPEQAYPAAKRRIAQRGRRRGAPGRPET
jgi:hypothetical protein